MIKITLDQDISYQVQIKRNKWSAPIAAKHMVLFDTISPEVNVIYAKDFLVDEAAARWVKQCKSIKIDKHTSMFDAHFLLCTSDRLFNNRLLVLTPRPEPGDFGQYYFLYEYIEV